MKDRGKRHPYLADPNYYRLGYQLAAQLLHLEYDPKEKGEYPGSAHETAKQILGNATAIRKWYEDRHRETIPKAWKKLKPSERKLQRFLTETIEPCLELVIAATLRAEEDCEAAEKYADCQRTRAVRRRLSYRALYNLGCYEAGDKDDPLKALPYLNKAFRQAPGSRQVELVYWAGKDPSLKDLHRKREFKEMLKFFTTTPKVKQPPSKKPKSTKKV